MLLYGFIHFHTPENAFISFYTLSYVFICFHTLSYALIHFHTLSYAFIRIIYALIRFYMHSTCYNMLLKAKVSQQQEMMLALCITGFCFAEAGKNAFCCKKLNFKTFSNLLTRALYVGTSKENMACYRSAIK